MTSVIDLEEETIFINRTTAGSASRVFNTTPLIYQPQRRSSKLRKTHFLLQKRQIYPSSNNYDHAGTEANQAITMAAMNYVADTLLEKEQR